MTCPHISSSLKPPRVGQAVHKEECTQCFDSQDSELGIDVCLTCFNAGCPSAATLSHGSTHSQKFNHPLAVNVKRRRKPTPISQRSDAEPPMKKLAVRQEATEAELYDWHAEARCYACDPAGRVLDAEEAQRVAPVVQGILASTSSAQQSEVQAWEEEILPCEHTHTLQQHQSFTLSPAGLATCSNCELKENLWLCLTCGTLSCGRKQFGGVPGGNGHALHHFEQSGHPVALKLGTIDADGPKADIYCYACNDAKLDDHLVPHLANFGINVQEQRKTEKSMTELQIEQNLKFDFAMSGSDGLALEPLFGPGLTGLKNLGNSCYMASTLQSLFSLPKFAERFSPADSRNTGHQFTCDKADPSQCLECQMIKMADGLLSGRYSVPRKTDPADQPALTLPPSGETVFTEGSEIVATKENATFQEGIKPSMFKNLVGKDHVEFKTMKQQDADEFIKHLLKLLEQNERRFRSDASEQVGDMFKFEMETRLACSNCNGVKYRRTTEESVTVPVAVTEKPSTMEIDGARDPQKKEYDAVSLESCFVSLTGEQDLEYNCPNCKQKQSATQTTKFATFPNVLMVHASRFQIVGWVPQKVDVPIMIQHEALDLSTLLSAGKQDHEVLLPEDETTAAAPDFNAAAMGQLEAMGFPAIRCQKALLATGNSDAEAAMQWLFEHMEDEDIDAPIQATTTASSTAEASPEQVSMIADMGFTSAQANKALRECGGSVERAIEWLFSHPDDSGEDQAPQVEKRSFGSANLPAAYKLKAFISHKGPSTHSGHYVAHVQTDNGWVLFNDEKVVKADKGEQAAETLSPYAYVYIFEKA